MPGLKILSGLTLANYACKCGNIEFMADQYPNCSKCGEPLPDRTMARIRKEYNKWWNKTFSFDVKELWRNRP
jgi:hypothetical protein